MRLTRNCKIDYLPEEIKDFAFMLPDYDYARNEFGFAISDTQQCLDKLGQLEDLMEKYEFETIEDLDEYLFNKTSMIYKDGKWQRIKE